MIEQPGMDEIRAAADELAGRLTAMRAPQGHWIGELSSSALSTATAAMALHAAGAPAGRADRRLVGAGLQWLAANRNADGGWGDTAVSMSNLSTTLLAWSVLSAAGGGRPDWRDAIDSAESWISGKIGGMEPGRIARALEDCYGRDKSFASPILAMLALAGVLGERPQCWGLVPALPFELAMLPRKLFRFLRLGVVSYALPALIAIGQVREKFRPAGCPVTRAIRRLAAGPTLRLLEKIQPAGGGYLEATPITSFVAMSLAAMGMADGTVSRRCLDFIRRGARGDGSWPIDADLSVWVTTLAVNALEGLDDSDELLGWLLDRQQVREHPYTLSPAGGWGWTDKSGGVPDADDTAGALLAVARLAGPDDRKAGQAAGGGLNWLLGLQNADGGIPTFCRGWGGLPFDRSSPDLTAHALAAMSVWLARRGAAQSGANHEKLIAGMRRMVKYLDASRRADGSWLALWFGNEHAKDQDNPVYCTARVASALRSLIGLEGFQADEPTVGQMLGSAVRWLVGSQNADGGWGGDAGVRSSVEETSLAVWALAEAALVKADMSVDMKNDELRRAALKGAGWLVERVRPGRPLDAAPIGLYFARLWYSEKLYPVIFAAGALRRAMRLC